MAADPGPELAHAAPDRVPGLGQPLRPQEHERDHEHEQDFR